MNKPRKKSGTVTFEVTEKQYQEMLAKGIDEESILKPGKHKFVRGLFKQMHPEYEHQKNESRKPHS
jgi:hypothetical protein